MARNNEKSKSTRRKPLGDVSNGGIKSEKLNKKKSNEDDSLDRLLLAHSDLSSILRQIDELVAQAVEVKANDKKKNEEIIAFANVLSEVHSSLKPSVLKLKEALSGCHIEPEIQLGETSVSSVRSPTVVDEGDEHGIDTPEPLKHGSLVSPSPLVSWRATDCLIERGKQLFLLTPLPRPRTALSKAHVSSKLSTFKATVLSTPLQEPAHCAQASECNDDNAKIVESTSCVGDNSTVLATPCFKIPPNSRAFLEPDCIIKSEKPQMFTPYPVGNKTLCELTECENSSGEVPDRLGFKYPELIGIKQSFMLGNGSKALEASPAWIMSPPKCCTLMEPIDEKPTKDEKAVASDFNQQVCLAPPNKSSIHTTDQDQEKKSFCGQGTSTAIVENTPLWKGSESIMHRGTRPGENTLKKELWTRFEAASIDGVHLNCCELERTSHKGFLDRLEEASSDEESPHSESFR